MVVGVVAASGAAQVPRFNPAHPRRQRLEVWGEADHKTTCGNLGRGAALIVVAIMWTPRACQKQNVHENIE